MTIKEENGYLNIGFVLNFLVVTLSNFSSKNCIEREQIEHVSGGRNLGSYF